MATVAGQHAAADSPGIYSYKHRPIYIYSMLDAVPPIHAESSHVATDKDPSK